MAPGKSVHEIALTAREASDNLSALSKHTYGKLFAWIVGFVNRCHHRHVGGLLHRGTGGGGGGEGEGGAPEPRGACTREEKLKASRLDSRTVSFCFGTDQHVLRGAVGSKSVCMYRHVCCVVRPCCLNVRLFLFSSVPCASWDSKGRPSVRCFPVQRESEKGARSFLIDWSIVFWKEISCGRKFRGRSGDRHLR